MEASSYLELVSNVFKMRLSNNEQIDPMYNLLKTHRLLKPSQNCDGFETLQVHVKTYDSSIWMFDDEAVCFISLWLDDSSSTLAQSRGKQYRFSLTQYLLPFLHCLFLRGTCVHFLHTTFPVGHQSIILVGTKVCEISQQAVSQFLIPQHTGPPGFGQHGVVGPIVAHSLLRTKQILIGRVGGVTAPPLSTGVFPFWVRQLKKNGTWIKGWTFPNVIVMEQDKEMDKSKKAVLV